MIRLSNEIKFKTARSGGKGGQNVNKVETMVEGWFDIAASALLTDEQKDLIRRKLANRITRDGFLLVKSQSERTQLANKEKVIFKLQSLINQSLKEPKKRKPTKPSKASQEKRIRVKKEKGLIKTGRKKISRNEE